MGLCALGMWLCTYPGVGILNACVIRTESLSVISFWRGSFEAVLWGTLAEAMAAREEWHHGGRR